MWLVLRSLRFGRIKEAAFETSILEFSRILENDFPFDS